MMLLDIYSAANLLETVPSTFAGVIRHYGSVAGAVAGIGILLYFGSKIWTSIAHNEAIDFYPLLKPLILFILCFNFNSFVINPINALFSPVKNFAINTIKGDEQALKFKADMLAKAAIKQDSIKTVKQKDDFGAEYYDMYSNKNVGFFKSIKVSANRRGAFINFYNKYVPNNKKSSWVEYRFMKDASEEYMISFLKENMDNKDKMTEEDRKIWDLMTLQYEENEAKPSWIMEGVIAAIVWLLDVLAVAAVYLLLAVRVCYLAILGLIGPFSFAASCFPIWEKSYTTWITKYVSVLFWLPVAFIILYLSSTVKTVLLNSLIGAGFEADMALVMKLLFSLVSLFLVVSVPTVTGWIIQGGASGSIGKAAAGIFGAGVGYLGGAIAGGALKAGGAVASQGVAGAAKGATQGIANAATKNFGGIAKDIGSVAKGIGSLFSGNSSKGSAKSSAFKNSENTDSAVQTVGSMAGDEDSGVAGGTESVSSSADATGSANSVARGRANGANDTAGTAEEKSKSGISVANIAAIGAAAGNVAATGDTNSTITKGAQGKANASKHRLRKLAKGKASSNDNATTGTTTPVSSVNAAINAIDAANQTNNTNTVPTTPANNNDDVNNSSSADSDNNSSNDSNSTSISSSINNDKSSNSSGTINNNDDNVNRQMNIGTAVHAASAEIHKTSNEKWSESQKLSDYLSQKDKDGNNIFSPKQQERMQRKLTERHLQANDNILKKHGLQPTKREKFRGTKYSEKKSKIK